MTPSALPTAREGRFILLLGALVAFGPLAIDLYLPALPAIATSLAATPEAVQLSITVFLCSFALFVSVSITGLLGANCVGQLMARYPANAGAAAALFGSSHFGAVAGGHPVLPAGSRLRPNR